MTMARKMTEMLPDSPEDVMHLLREQSSLYTKLESVSARQRSLVTEDDVSPLLALLTDRQRLSEQLQQIATRLAPVRREWDSYRERLTPEQRSEAGRLLDESGQRLRQLIDNDEQDARVLSGRKQAVARVLRTTHSTSQAISAYRAPTDRSGRLDCVNEGA